MYYWMDPSLISMFDGHAGINDPNEHNHEPGEVFPIKCPLVDAASVYREREGNDRGRINQAIAIEAKEALKRKDWDAANWTRYQTVLEGE